MVGNVLNIPVERLVVSKNEQISHREYKDEGLQSLKDSIANVGMLTPLYVVSISDSENYEIIDGYHRFQVAKELGMTGVPCIVAPQDVFKRVCDLAENGNVKSDDVAMVLNALQNTQRQNITFEEMAALFNTLRGVVKADSRTGFFGKLGVSEKDVKRYDAYLDLTDEQKNLLKDNGYEFTEAVAESMSAMGNAQRLHFLKTIVDMGVKNSEVGPLMKVAARACAKLPGGIQTKFGKNGLPLRDSVVSYMARWDDDTKMESAYRIISEAKMDADAIENYCFACNKLGKIWPEAVDITANENLYGKADFGIIDLLNHLGQTVIDKYEHEKESSKKMKEDARSKGMNSSEIQVFDLEFDSDVREDILNYLAKKNLFQNEIGLSEFVEKFESDFLNFPYEIQRCYWDQRITLYPPAYPLIRNILNVTTADMPTKINKVVEILENCDKPEDDTSVSNTLASEKDMFVLELNSKGKGDDVLSGLVGNVLAKNARDEVAGKKNDLPLPDVSGEKTGILGTGYSFEEKPFEDDDQPDDDEEDIEADSGVEETVRKPFKNSRPEETVWDDEPEEDVQASFFDDIDDNTEEETPEETLAPVRSAIDPEAYPFLHDATRLMGMDGTGKNPVSGRAENIEDARKVFVHLNPDQLMEAREWLCEGCIRDYKRLNFDTENHCRECKFGKFFWHCYETYR